MSIPPLWDHQQKSVDNFMGSKIPYRALFFEQGTGKTPTTLQLLRFIYRQSKRGLKTIVFCPAIVIPNWKREAEKWTKFGHNVELLTGSKKKRIELLESSDKFVFVTNFEALDMDGLFWEKVGKSTRRIIRDFDCLVVDESQRVKNPQAKRTKTMIKLADTIYYRFILTGTPTPKSPLDIWSQYRILDHGKRFGTNYFAFRNEYFLDVNSGMPSQKHFPSYVPKPGALEKMNRLIYSCADQARKADCLDLPPFIETKIPVELTRTQKSIYKSMESELIAIFQNNKTQEVHTSIATIALTKILRLNQICSGFVKDDEENICTFDENRSKALQDILEDCYGATIVWCTFQQNYEQVEKVCIKLGKSYTHLTGMQSQKQKEENVDKFQTGEFDVLIANPSAGGTGVNLQRSNVSIWFSHTYNLEHREQAKARNYRGGSNIHRSITNYDLYTPGTIESKILEALNSKKSVAEMLLSVKKGLR